MGRGRSLFRFAARGHREARQQNHPDAATVHAVRPTALRAIEKD
jgi:hypothetical protein